MDHAKLIELMKELHRRGDAHSVDVWERAPGAPGGKRLVGGLYGVSSGGAFFGESQFSRVPNVSKLATIHLVSVLKEAGYTLLDTQFVSDHLAQFGTKGIPQAEYLERLATALQDPRNPSARFSEAAAQVVQQQATQAVKQQAHR